MMGAVARLWGLPRLGLSHFDEGIYAIAGLWSVSPGGLAGLDRSLIPYAPPGFPFLVGCSYLGLGVSDLAAILVSIGAGTLTIPAAAWLARRTFGAGAGAAAAALVAFSGFHAAFSRMALTDASLMLCWVIGLVIARRFLERPGLSSCRRHGTERGAGAVVQVQRLAARGFRDPGCWPWDAGDPGQRLRARIQATWGFVLVALLVAAAVYWPWFSYVQSHGGYAGLLQHHRSYMGGVGSWLLHLRIQLEQAAALSGGPAWNLSGYLAAILSNELVLAGQPRPVRYRYFLTLALLLVGVVLLPFLYWVIGATSLLHPSGFRSPSKRLLAAAWLFSSVLTPFYHPYARLWLPLHFLGWIWLAGLMSQGIALSPGESANPPSALGTWGSFTIRVGVIILLLMALLAIEFPSSDKPRSPTMGPGELPGPLAPSDSLRNSVRKAVADLPPGTAGLRLLARPPVTFYLAGRVAVYVEPDLAHLNTAGDSRLWALVDFAQLRQERDPQAATAARSSSAGSSFKNTLHNSVCRPCWTSIRRCPVRQVGVVDGPALAASPQNRRTRAMNSYPRPPVSLWPDRRALGPVTDLYQLTMMAGYLASGMAEKRATFDLFVRRMPPNRAYLVFAGLEQAVGDLLALAFSADQIEGIRRFPAFAHADPAFFQMLGSLRFEGDLWAAPEGTVVFPGETFLRLTAPLPQAQWVETFLLASLSYPTLVASKAARTVTAARGRTLIDFGARRGHGPHSGLLAARAAYVAGFDATSHVEAARLLQIPASGTMAHSWVQSFDTEAEAFAAYAKAFPGSTTLLIDTYDTLEGARKAAAIVPPVQAVRLDSGDLESLARGVRNILDDHDRKSVKILASGDLDESRIEQLLAASAPIDGFGVGTELITSRDAPRCRWCTSWSRSTVRARSSSVPARRPTQWPSRSTASVTARGSSGAMSSSAPTKSLPASRFSFRSSARAGW